jgi:hypothetical protein
LAWYSQHWSGLERKYARTMLNKAYLKEEFLVHFEECESVKDLWDLHLREGKGLRHLYRGRHREWDTKCTHG